MTIRRSRSWVYIRIGSVLVYWERPLGLRTIHIDGGS